MLPEEASPQRTMMATSSSYAEPGLLILVPVSLKTLGHCVCLCEKLRPEDGLPVWWLLLHCCPQMCLYECHLRQLHQLVSLVAQTWTVPGRYLDPLVSILFGTVTWNLHVVRSEQTQSFSLYFNKDILTWLRLKLEWARRDCFPPTRTAGDQSLAIERLGKAHPWSGGKTAESHLELWGM